jgi:hydrogenase maturation protease
VTEQSKILVAGIGNVFLGDDGFGVAVVNRLKQKQLGSHVEVVDFGIRGMDLAYALMGDYELVILVDALPRGGPIGSVYVLEPSVSSIQPNTEGPDTHAMDPLRVLQLVHAMEALSCKVLIVGCEPGRLDSDWERGTELSAEVAAGVDEAITIIERLCEENHA